MIRTTSVSQQRRDRASLGAALVINANPRVVSCVESNHKSGTKFVQKYKDRPARPNNSILAMHRLIPLLSRLRPSAQLLCRMSVVFICALVAVLRPTRKLTGPYSFLILTAKVRRVCCGLIIYVTLFRTLGSPHPQTLQHKSKH